MPPLVTVVTLVYAALLTAVVSSLGAPLIPDFARAFHVSLSSSQWLLTITMLVGTACAPLMGRLADNGWRREMVMTGLLMLCAGSVLGGTAGGYVELLLARGLQGAGLGLLPVLMGIARHQLDEGRARSTVSTLSVTAAVGMGLGYPVTGVLAEHWGFRAPFWMAVALSAIAAAAAFVVLKPDSNRSTARLDYCGTALLAAGLAALLIWISDVGVWGMSSPRGLAFGSAALVLLTAWVIQALHTEAPIVDLRVSRNRSVAAANVTMAVCGVGLYAAFSMAQRYLQAPRTHSFGLGQSVLVSAATLIPCSAASLIASVVLNRAGRRWHASWVLVVGVVSYAASEFLFAFARGSVPEVLIVMAVLGFASGIALSAAPRLIVAAVPPSHTSSSLALNAVVRTIGYAIGSAYSGAILAAHTHPPFPFPRASGYTMGAVVAGIATLVALVCALVLPDRSLERAGANQDRGPVHQTTEPDVSGIVVYEASE